MKTTQISPVQYSILKIIAFVATAGLVFAFGCQSQKAEPATTTAKVSSDELNLQGRLEQCQKENEQLKKQVETLSELPGNKRADAIYHLQSVKIGRYTNIYAEDGNSGTPGKEKLVVYVKPEDETGDAIKAAGAVSIQLWDLNKKESESLIGQWQIEPNELKKLWLNSMFGGSYRLSFDLASGFKKTEKPLTVKVNFTDYLSGRTFIEEKALKP